MSADLAQNPSFFPGIMSDGRVEFRTYSHMSSAEWLISNATLVGAGETQTTAGLHFASGRIAARLAADSDTPELLNLNLHGLAVYPGLVNAHDSLLATYEPFAGDGQPYLNWLAYDNQLKASPLFKERMLVPVGDLYRLGAFRNLLSGVTTVADHIPHFVREPFQDDPTLPVRLLADFGISHSICSYSLDWGDGPRAEYERAAAAGLPYITHIAEGTDPESKNSLRRLDRDGALGEHTVLVHGVGLSESDLDLIAGRGASLVWCPVMNEALYGATLPIGAALEREIPVSLGSDAAMLGSPNLLADLRRAGQLLSEAGYASEQALAMATTNPAAALRLPEGSGTLDAGAPGDCVVLRGKYPTDPHRSLLEAELAEVFLVVRDGVPVYGDEQLEPIFTELGLIFDRVSIGGSRKIVVGQMKKLLESIRATVGRSGFPFLS